MRIAVCTDQAGRTSQIWAGAAIRIYSKKNNQWFIDEELPYTLSSDLTLAKAKQTFHELLQQLKACTVFVATEISGQLYYQLEFRHMNSYHAEGDPVQYLDSILEAEIAEQTLSVNHELTASESIKPQLTQEDGVYYFNLSKAMAENPCLSSKSLLRPFLAARGFKKLIVDCQHIPRWFESELKSQNFSYSINFQSEKITTVHILPIKS